MKWFMKYWNGPRWVGWNAERVTGVEDRCRADVHNQANTQERQQVVDNRGQKPKEIYYYYMFCRFARSLSFA